MTMSFFGDKSREDDLFYALAQELEPAAVESASVAASEVGADTNAALASVIATLAKFAETLDDAGHPSAVKVDNVLNFIEQEFTTNTVST